MRSDFALVRSAPADLFVLGLRLSGRHCLLVGSGAELDRRIRAFLAADARVSVVSERPPESVRVLARSGATTLLERPFEEADLAGVWLAVLTDFDATLAAVLFRATEERRIFFCAVDQPDFCSFSHLAIARVSDVTVAVSTGGRAPALARRLREEMGRLLDESAIGPFVERLAALRERTASPDRRGVLGAAVARVRITGNLELPQDDET
jgi:siroheme synthase-like protein